MAKKKGRDRKKKISAILLLIVLPTFLMGIVLLSRYLGFTDRSTGSPPHLPYEEIYSSSVYLKEKIKKIDYAIYESFYQSGVQEREVIFLNVQPRHYNGYVWDFTEIFVECSDHQSIIERYRVINRDLAEIEEGIGLKKEIETKDKVVCLVFVKDFQTHKIIFSTDSKLQPVKDVRPKVAIIVDDLGYNANTDFLFFQLELPLSFSVLPYGPSTQSIVRKANQEHKELILHLPMEPKNYPSVNPGPGGLFLSMEVSEIRRVLDQDLRQIAGVRGVNNHMGSSFTENTDKMLIVLNELKKKGLFFIDSRTTKHTVALDLARKIGLPSARRRVFLDNNLAPKALKIQMERLLNMARHLGTAIGICHPYKETYILLKQYRSKLRNEFQIVPVSELVS